MMFTVTTTSKQNCFPDTNDNVYIYNNELIEDVVIHFGINENKKTCQILGIEFSSANFIHNNQREVIANNYFKKFTKKIVLSKNNRVNFFSESSQTYSSVFEKLKYECRAAAACIIQEYLKLLSDKEELTVFYKVDEDEQCIIAYMLNEPSESMDVSLDGDVMQLEDKLENCGMLEKEEIGRIQVKNTADDLYWLEYIEVSSNFKRLGIGTTLLKLAKEYLQLNAIPCVKYSPQYRFYLKSAEEKFICYCIKTGNIDIDMCYFSDPSDMSYKFSPSILQDEAENPYNDSALIKKSLEELYLNVNHNCRIGIKRYI